jgi:hypothetical protein
MSEGMKEVVVVFDYGMYTRELLRFRQWLVGWLYDKYNVANVDTTYDDYVAFKVGIDLLELFGELYSEMKLVRRDLKADINAVGLCSGDECVVVDFEPRVVLSNYALKKLNKIVNRIKHVAGVGKVEDMVFAGRDGEVAIYMKGCYASLYINEALVVAADLVRYVRNISKLETLDEVDFIFDLFELPEPRSLAVDFVTDEDGIIFFVDRCSTFLTIGEALRVAYWLMKLSLDQLKAWKKEKEKKGYE